METLSIVSITTLFQFATCFTLLTLKDDIDMCQLYVLVLLSFTNNQILLSPTCYYNAGCTCISDRTEIVSYSQNPTEVTYTLTIINEFQY